MKRYVGLGKETTYGTAVAATRYAEAITSITADQHYNIPPPIASRAFRKRNLGPYRARGTIGDFPVEPENIIGELLLGGFGSVTTSEPAVGVKLHTFSPADALPSYTARVGVEQTERVLPGGLIESLTVKFVSGRDIHASAELLSGFVESKAAIATPTISTLQALNMQEPSSVLTVDGVSKRDVIYDLEITIKNNIPFDRGALDGRTFSKKRVGQREVTGRLSAFFDDTSEYDRFIGGSEFTLVVRADGPVITGTYRYHLSFELRRCAYTGGVPDVRPRNEPLVANAPFQALLDAGFGAEAKATLQNTIASY